MATGAIGNSLSSLKLLNQKIDVISNNIANASTIGYTRKELPQYSTVSSQTGGVTAGVLKRNMDAILQRDLFTQSAQSTALKTKEQYFSTIQSFHRQPEDNRSITAELGQLKDAFAQFANAPESVPLLDNVFNQATYFAGQINEFSKLLSQLRNDAQNEMQQVVSQLNVDLENVAELNLSIKVELANGRSVATLEDQRDLILTNLAKELDIDYYTSQDGVVTVMTRQGTVLADTQARPLLFNPQPVGATTYYPDSVAGLYVETTTGIDLAAQSRVGGRIGALLDLRDTSLPQYQAQLDELAHKTALRFDEAGLRMFSNPNGSIPANNPADYAGFAASIQVNPSIIADHDLIRNGTSGNTLQSGSAAVARRVIDYVFGDKSAIEALGAIDISGVGDLYTTLGINARSQTIGTTNIQSLSTLDTSEFIASGTSDTFTIAVGAGLPQDIVIGAGDTAGDLVNTINGIFPGMASLGPSGQLVLTGTEDFVIGTNNLTPAAFTELGIATGTYTASSPFFSIAVGIDDPVKIFIDPADTGADLVNRINMLVPSVTASLDVNGFLMIVPNDGGDISLIEGQGNPLAALVMSIDPVTHTAFNATSLGPGGNLSGRISTAQTLQEYSEFMISIQSSDAAGNAQEYQFEETYRQTLEKQILDFSGVNLDEEMAALIQVQTAYAASAKVIETVNQMLDELFAAFL